MRRSANTTFLLSPVLTFALLIGCSADKQKFNVQWAHKTSNHKETKGDLLYRQDGVVSVFQEKTAASSAPTFAAQLPFNFSEKDLSQYGNVLYFKQGFGLLEMSDSQRDELSLVLHEKGMGCGIVQKLDTPLAAQSVSKIVEPLTPLSFEQKIKETTEKVSEENIQNFVTDLSSISTRHHASATGIGVASKVLEAYKKVWNPNIPATFSIVEHTGTKQPSFIVRIEGAQSPEQIIIFGSHIDSISRGDIAPGADDNASGTSTNLELFRLINEKGIIPQRTIEFHGYAAEEIGLVGSKEIAKSYKKSQKNVVAMIQFDMNIFKSQNETDKIWFVTNNTNAELTNSLELLVKTYTTIPTGKKPLGSGSSDHASWDGQGFPAAFPFENPSNYNRNIHTPKDTIANSGSFSQAVAFAKMGIAFIEHYAFSQNNH